MAGQIAEAYVQIIPTTDGITDGIGSALGDQGKKGGKSFGKGFLGTATKIIGAIGIADVFKKAIEAGGAIQQSFGGLETIYGDAATAAKGFAKEASSAGISANTYAEQAVSFGAALKKAYGGDTIKAMNAANTAIMDMADNSAKMGTDITSLQSAYQGFAKQNYTMLDNLKLGYGGTKTEMERLLKDATALSGVKYDINNLGDVYDAIHVIQEDLGLTGVAAYEAQNTFTGSFGAMKAAAQNFLADLALGEDISGSLSTLSNTVVTFMGNVVPMIVNIVGAAPQALTGLLTGLAPVLLKGGMDAIMQLGSGIAAALPGLISGIVDFIPQLVSGFATALPQLVSLGAEIIMALANGLIAAIPGLVAQIPALIAQLANGISSSVGIILSAGMQLFTGLLEAIPPTISAIVAALPQIITSITEFLVNNVNRIVAAAITLFMGLVEAIPEIISALIAAAPEIISAFINAITTLIPALFNAGVALFTAVVNGIVSLGAQLVTAAKNLISQALAGVKSFASSALSAGKTFAQNIASGISSGVSAAVAKAKEIGTKILAAITGFVGQMVSAGQNLLRGVAEGIGNAIGEVVARAKAAAQKVVGAVKGFLGIASPSKLMRDEVGKFMMLGFAEGIEENTAPVANAIDEVGAMAAAGFDNTLGVNAALGVSTDTEATNELAQLIRIVNGLSAKIDNLKIYLDGERLVGGIAGNMDNALGGRSLMAERGLA